MHSSSCQVLQNVISFWCASMLAF